MNLTDIGEGVAMIGSKSLFLMAIGCMIIPAPVHAEDPLPEIVLKFLAYVERIETVEYDCESVTITPEQFERLPGVKSAADGGQRFNVGTCQIDLRNNSERFDLLPDQDPLERIEIYRDGYRIRFNPGLNQGAINRKKDSWDFSIPKAFGYVGGYMLGDRTGESLSEILLKRKYIGSITTTEDSFTIPKVYGRPNSPVQVNLVVRLSKEHDFCPVELHDVDVNPKDPSQTRERFMVRTGRFERIQDMWIPTMVACRTITPDAVYCGASFASNMKVNQPFSKPMDFVFPADSVYYDERDGTLHGRAPQEEIIFKREEVGERIQEQVVGGTGWWKSISIVFASTLVILFLWSRWRNRASHCIVLAFGALGVSGCTPEGSDIVKVPEVVSFPEADERKDSNSSQLATLICNDPLPVQVEFPKESGEIEREVAVAFRNDSQQMVRLPESIVTSCGCTSAVWDKSEVEPGGGAKMTLKITKPTASSKKYIQATSKVLDQAGATIDEISVGVSLKIDFDWECIDSQINLSGEPGTDAVGAFRIRQKTSTPPRISFPSMPQIQVLEVVEVDAVMHLYDVKIACRGPFSRDTYLGLVNVEYDGGNPSLQEVAIYVKLKERTQWRYRVLDLSKNDRNELPIPKGYSWVRNEVEPSVAGIASSQESSVLQVDFSQSERGFGVSKFRAVLSNQEGEVPCEFIVLSVASSEAE